MRRSRWIPGALLLSLALFPSQAAAACGAVTSAQSGNWSAATTWTGGATPTSCNSVSVQSGHTVVIDTLSATASTTTISGHLLFSRSTSSRLTLIGGTLDVLSGGWLDLGTSASIIPSSIRAELVLALGGSFTNIYPLSIRDGGRFSSYGAVKSPFGLASQSIPAGSSTATISAAQISGWSVGDLIEIGPTSGSAANANVVWRATVTAVGAGTVNFAPPVDVARNPSTSLPVVIANLTRNVLVRSSGTVVETTQRTTSEIQNFSQTAANFDARNSEFAYLGGWGSGSAILYSGTGTAGAISSSTFHDGYNGVTINAAADITLDYDVFARNRSSAVAITNGAPRTRLIGVVCAGSGQQCVSADGPQTRIEDSYLFATPTTGGLIFYQANATVTRSWIYSHNIGVNMGAAATGLIIAQTQFMLNSFEALDGQSVEMAFVGDSFYSNAMAVRLRAGASAVLSNARLGYDLSGASAADGPELSYVFDGVTSLKLLGSRINPANAVDTTWMKSPGSSIISYDQDFATGTVRVWGHHIVYSTNPITLDNSLRVYTSSATAPKLMKGSGHALAVCATDDSTASSQLVTVEFDGSLWRVTGSAGGYLGALSPSTCASPTNFGQFSLALTAAAPQAGDRFEFALLPASPVAAVQKKLFFQSAASGYNAGKAILAVSPSGSLQLKGSASSSVLIDRAGSPYGTLISSGVFSAEYAALYDLDALGLQLSGTGGVSLATTTFDFMGVAAGTNTYITARSLTSAATFYNISFLNSRSTATANFAYNVRVVGSPSLNWLFRGRSGKLWGERYDDDSGNLVFWDPVPLSPPTGFVGTPSGATSLVWAWANNDDDAETYRVMSGAANLSGDLGAVSSWTQTGLTPNTGYGPYRVRLVEGVATADSGSAFTILPARAPTTTTAALIYSTGAILTWSLNGNNAATLAQVQRSTDNFKFDQIAQASVTATTANLFACTTYYFRVRNVGLDGLPTAYDATLSLITLPGAPAAPSGLTATSLAGRKISLSWLPSPAPNVLGYNLYYDNGTGTIDYTTPYAVLSSTSLAFVTPALTSGTRYLFGLRARACGLTESNTDLRAAATALTSLTGVRARIKNPDSGKKIGGNSVLVMAEIITGDDDQTREIRFQYKASASSTWLDLPPAGTGETNPKRGSPFKIHWDVTILAGGPYDLRAVATDVNNAVDPAPAVITVTIDNSNAELIQTNIGGGKVQVDQTMTNTVANTVRAANQDAAAVVTEITIPPSAVSETTTTIRIINNPTGTPQSTTVNSIGAVTEVTLQNGQHQLSNGQSASITISYPDDNNDGVVDGTAIRAENLKMYTFNTTTNEWVQEFNSVVNLTSHTVTGYTTHFSLFGLFTPSVSTTLDAVRIYPNPFKPNDADPDNGVPFSAGDPTSGIVFDTLPASATIDIFSLAGQKVAKLTAATGATVIQWDARTENGRDVATGIYFAVIKAPGSKPLTRKLLVIR